MFMFKSPTLADPKCCFVCGTSDSTTFCEGCQTVSYCTPQHQTQDWDSHKDYCVKVKDAPNTLKAILFAANETKPRIVKIPYKIRHDGATNEPVYHDLDYKAWFPGKFTFVYPLFFGKFGVLGLELGYGMCFFYDEEFLQNGSPVNKCIQEVTRGHSGIEWRGNVLAVRLQKRKDGRDSFELFEDVVPEKDLLPCVRNFEEHEARVPSFN